MKKFIAGFVAGGIICSGVTIFASNGIKEAYFNNEIKVQANGVDTGVKAVTVVTDDNPDGSTYLPIRKAAEALGKDIQWDSNTNTANIIEKGSSLSSTGTNNITTLKIGDTYKSSNFSITLESIKKQSGYVYFNLRIINNTGKDLNSLGKYNLDYLENNTIKSTYSIYSSIANWKENSGYNKVDDMSKNIYIPLSERDLSYTKLYFTDSTNNNVVCWQLD